MLRGEKKTERGIKTIKKRKEEINKRKKKLQTW
jgi:hypothetical protein